MPPKAKYIAKALMHVPGMLGSHCLATGEQPKANRKANISWLAVTRPRVTYKTIAYVLLKPATRR